MAVRHCVKQFQNGRYAATLNHGQRPSDDDTDHITTPSEVQPSRRNPRAARGVKNCRSNSQLLLYRQLVARAAADRLWKEMFDQKILLTKASVREHLDVWKSLLLRADPKAQIKEEKNADGTLTVTYTALAGNEMGISRYFKGSDGIYIFSYRVRPQLKSEERWQIWRGILSSARLIPNPLKKSR